MRWFAGRRAGRAPPGGRRRSSLLPKILLAVLVALAVGSAVTTVFETGATRDTLRQEARDMLRRELSVVQAALEEDQRRIEAGLRNAAQRIALRNLTDPARSVELLTELERTRRAGGFDGIAAVTPQGQVVEAVGAELPPPSAPLTGRLEQGASRLLVRTPGGAYARTTVVPVHTDRLRLLLAGGLLFGDAAAFELRTIVGHDVLLFADGQVVGTTLPELPGQGLPLASVTTDDPTVTAVGGRDMFVGAATLTSDTDPWQIPAAVGVAISDPVAQLDRSLTRTRATSAALLVLIALGVAWLLFRHLTRPLRQLVGTAQRIAAGDLDATFQVRSRDEVGELAGALERMRAAIGDQLAVIRQQAQAVRASTRRIAAARDDERRRLANDLHDGIQQQLVMLRVRLGLVRRLADQHPERAQSEWSALVDQVDDAIQALRETSRHIFPSILADRGLDGALHSLAGRAPVPVDIQITPDPLPRLRRDVEANAYFLVAEAVTNAVKHAQAGRIEVTVGLERPALRIRVADDGCGLDEDSTLVHLRDRAVAAGGHLDVTSPGDGTVVAVLLPVTPDEPDGDGAPSRSSAAGRTAPQPRGG